MEESIYNIIPKEYTPPPKEPLYRSKFPPNIKPTGSTFCHHTTSKPIVNLHSFRTLTSAVSSNTVSRHTLSTAIQKLWDT